MKASSTLSLRCVQVGPQRGCEATMKVGHRNHTTPRGCMPLPTTCVSIKDDGRFAFKLASGFNRCFDRDRASSSHEAGYTSRFAKLTGLIHGDTKDPARHHKRLLESELRRYNQSYREGGAVPPTLWRGDTDYDTNTPKTALKYLLHRNKKGFESPPLRYFLASSAESVGQFRLR